MVLSTKSEKKYFPPPKVVIFFLLLLTIALKRCRLVSLEKGALPRPLLPPSLMGGCQGLLTVMLVSFLPLCEEATTAKY